MKRDLFVYRCGYCGASYRQPRPMEKCAICWQPAGEWLRCVSHPAEHAGAAERQPTEEPAREWADTQAHPERAA